MALAPLDLLAGVKSGLAALLHTLTPQRSASICVIASSVAPGCSAAISFRASTCLICLRWAHVDFLWA